MNAVLRGAASGVVASGAMSLFLEAAKHLGTIDREPPAIVTDTLERKTQAPVVPGAAFRTRWILVHLAFGAAMGGVFGALRDVLPRNTAAAGASFGAGLWATMYPFALPLTGLYPRLDHDWEPRAATIAAAHLVYGTTMAAAFDLVDN